MFAYVLPLAERLVENGEFWEVLSYDVQDGGFSTADVALNRDETWSAEVCFWR